MDSTDGAISFLFVSVVAMVLLMAQATLAAEETSEPLELTMRKEKEKVTHLHFYFHDTVSGNNPTGVKVARAPTTDKSPTAFGLLAIIDDPLTEGPEPTSKLLGRAQGLTGFDGQEELSLIMALSYVFTEGKFNGSSLSVLTQNQIMRPVREFPIVGGTGCFRLARGFAVAKTYWANATTGDAIVEYNMTVFHY